MLRTRTVKKIHVTDYVCDGCGSDNFNIKSFLTYPQQYEYTCIDCKKSWHLKERPENVVYEFEGEKDPEYEGRMQLIREGVAKADEHLRNGGAQKEALEIMRNAVKKAG